MPITDAVNTAGEMAFVYPGMIATLGDTDGEPPERPDTPLTDPVTAGASTVLTENDYEVRRVIQSAGGAKLDFCELRLRLGAPLESQVQPADFSRMVEVSLPTANADPIFRGDLSSETHTIQQSNETLVSTAQQRGYHFGPACRGQLWRDTLYEGASGSGSGGVSDLQVDHEIVFNPTVDGQRLANRSDLKRADGFDAFLWIHPEAARTTYAQDWSGQIPQMWNLLEAVLALCWLLNTDEQFVTNPTRAELTTALADSAFDIVDNARLENGHHLPWYLDRILQPYGFNWFVDYAVTGGSGAEETEAKIVCFKRGAGTEKELHLQAVGSVLTLADSNINNVTIRRDIGEAKNEVTARGSMQVREITLELERAWPESKDTLTAADLDSSDENSVYVGNEKVWRMWIGNEAGDAVGLRASVHPAGDPPDFFTIFDKWIPHRTPMGDCLSYYGGDDSTERQPPFVEYSIDAGTTWIPVPDSFGDVLLLPDQIGVNFARRGEPPAELLAAGEDARVRVTGTITGDSAIEFVAARQAHAVNGRVVPLHREMRAKFVDAAVQTTGDFASVIASSGGDAGQNHEAEIEEFAEQLRDEYEAADMSCHFVLPGWHRGAYGISDLLTNIAGREISLNRASATAPAARYPQILEIEYGTGQAGPYTVIRVDRNAS